MNDAAEDPRCRAESSEASAGKEEIDSGAKQAAEPLDDILGNIAQALQGVKGVLANAIENYPLERSAIATRPNRSPSEEGSG